MNTDKVNATKEKLKTAFLELYSIKRIEKISIKEITDRAGVNRGTFYAYYIDIYDLQEKLEDEAMIALKQKIVPIIRKLILDGQLDVEFLPKEFFYKNPELAGMFFGERAELRAVNKLKTFMKENILTVIEMPKNLSKESKRKIEYTLEYVSSAQLAIVGLWFRNNMELSMEELGEMIEKINMRGSISYLKDIFNTNK